MGISLWRSAGFFIVVFWIAIHLFPSHRELGMLYSRSQLFSEAQFYLAKQFFLDPRDLANTLRYLKSLADSGDERIFEKAADRAKRQIAAPAVIYRAAGDFYESRFNLSKASKEWLRYLDLNPQDQEIRLKLISYLRLTKQDEALEHFLKSEMAKGKASIQAYYDLAELFDRRLKAEESEALYLLLLKHFPGEVKAQESLIRVLEYQHKTDEALRLYEEIYRRTPGRREAAWGLARALFRQKKYAEALAVTGSWLAQQSGDMDFVRLTADLLMRENRKEEALPYFEQIYRSRESVGSDDGRSLAELYYALGRYEDALKILETENEKTRNDYRTHHLLGDVLSRLGDSEGAKREYETALGLLRN